MARRGGIWPEWGRATRADILRRSHVGRNGLIAAQQLLSAIELNTREAARIASLSGDVPAQYAALGAAQATVGAMIEQFGDILIDLKQALVCFGEIELALRQLEKPAGVPWPRFARQIYDDLLDHAVNGGDRLKRIIAQVEAAIELLQPLVALRRTRRSVTHHLAAVRSTMRLLSERQTNRRTGIDTMMNSTITDALEILNILLSARQEGEDE